MNKRFAIFAGVGLVVIAIAVALIFMTTKGAHLELQGEIVKARTGALGDQDSIAVLDFRIRNPSDIPFIIREVTVTLQKPDGDLEGQLVSKSDLNKIFAYNRFLGPQYNQALTLRDRIPPHGTADWMVAARFEVPQATLEKAGAIKLWVQDVGGTQFQTVYKLG